jgi:RNA polymerase sigma-70 factor, ECF subfamily
MNMSGSLADSKPSTGARATLTGRTPLFATIERQPAPARPERPRRRTPRARSSPMQPAGGDPDTHAYMNERPPLNPIERSLVERFLERRSDATFSALYAHCTPRVYGLIVRQLGPLAAHVDDAFQETWTRAIAALPEFAWRSSLTTWICGIAVNCCREIRRRERRNAPDGAQGFGGDDAPVESQAPPFDGADRIDLERAIERLAPGYREVLLLHDVHGLRHEDIAGMLGIEPGTSKSQLSRARRALREALAPNVIPSTESAAKEFPS